MSIRPASSTPATAVLPTGHRPHSASLFFLFFPTPRPCSGLVTRTPSRTSPHRTHGLPNLLPIRGAPLPLPCTARQQAAILLHAHNQAPPISCVVCWQNGHGSRRKGRAPTETHTQSHGCRSFSPLCHRRPGQLFLFLSHAARPSAFCELAGPPGFWLGRQPGATAPALAPGEQCRRTFASCTADLVAARPHGQRRHARRKHCRCVLTRLLFLAISTRKIINMHGCIIPAQPLNLCPRFLARDGLAMSLPPRAHPAASASLAARAAALLPMAGWLQPIT
ncbi:hypothetical protein GQ54DRAFT_165263 [Martensiomyces pterosporus]|nr:hypothetical protein GQ54DRAFT_165263 [Martensiomyces pterosporus]